jgi:DegV family protein with EDD domain
MKIIISTESTHDLSQELIKENDIRIIPYHITLGEETFVDGEKTTLEMFEYVDKTGVLPKTNAINVFEYEEYFTELLKECDAVVHISLSSGLTSSTNNAILASKNVENVFVVDSKSLSTGIGLLVLYAKELANQGLDAKEIAEKVEARTEKVQASFIVERLDYLHKGGRCSGFQLLGANLLKIRPRLVVKDGKIINDKKYRGDMAKSVDKYCRDILSEFDTPDLDKVFITYTTATPEMEDAARQVVTEAGFKNIYQTNAGGTIASHCGAHTIGILYFNDGDK